MNYKFMFIMRRVFEYLLVAAFYASIFALGFSVGRGK